MEINLSEIFAHNAARSARVQAHRVESLNRARASAARPMNASTPAPGPTVSGSPTPDPAPPPRETGTTTDPARYTHSGEPMQGPGTTPLGVRHDGTDILASDVVDAPESAYQTLSGAASLTSTGESILSILRRTEGDDGVIRSEADYQAQLAAHRGLPPEPPLPAGYDGNIKTESDYQKLLKHHRWQQQNRR